MFAGKNTKALPRVRERALWFSDSPLFVPEGNNPVAAGFLGKVQSFIGLIDRSRNTVTDNVPPCFSRRTIGLPIERESCAHRHFGSYSINGDEDRFDSSSLILSLPELPQNLLRRRIVKCDDDLVAAESGNDVSVPKAMSRELLRNGSQNGIASSMTLLVVDRLEEVDIEMHDSHYALRQRTSRAVVLAHVVQDIVHHHVVESAPGKEPGQGIATEALLKPLDVVTKPNVFLLEFLGKCLPIGSCQLITPILFSMRSSLKRPL